MEDKIAEKEKYQFKWININQEDAHLLKIK